MTLRWRTGSATSTSNSPQTPWSSSSSSSSRWNIFFGQETISTSPGPTTNGTTTTTSGGGGGRAHSLKYGLVMIVGYLLILPERSGPSWTIPPTSEPGYSQGSVVSGAIFHGTPHRIFQGQRIFTKKGWEQRIGKTPLTWERLSSLLMRRGGATALEVAVTAIDAPSASSAVPSCSKWSVVTTIFDPSEAILDAATNFGDDWCIVIVGDKKSPANFLNKNDRLKNNPSVVYFDVAQQEAWTRLPGELGEFLRLLPYNHFGRKNFGYIYAILRGAKFVYDFDDDNYVIKDTSTGKPMSLIPNEREVANVRQVEVETDAFNHHPLMGASIPGSWARGFPLEKIQNETTFGKVVSVQSMPMEQVGVIQYVANGNPDVDAIHRLTKPLPMFFADDSSSSPIRVPHTTSVPYNAQATIHHRPALFALLLPMTVQSRVSDIWRAYSAGPLFRDIGVSVLFAPPRIEQVRTAHTYIGDMKAEGDLYFKSNKLTQFVREWKSSERSLPARMEQLWIELYERGYHEQADVLLVQRWLAALVQIQYDFKTPTL